ncbi:hypothetical protein CsSME_00053236 [Camellia sinensis var. sinensis]
MEFMAVDSEGSTGGLLCIWDPDIFQISECCNNRRFIIQSGDLWDSLLNLKEFLKPWCLAGDFNEITTISERNGCSRRDRSMKESNEFIDKSEWKTKTLKLGLKKWNLDVFGNINYRLKATEDELHRFDLLAEGDSEKSKMERSQRRDMEVE